MSIRFPNYVIVKAILGCNLACTYCCVDNARGARTLKHKSISMCLVERFIQEYQALPSRSRHLHYTWHGGEPMLAGIEFYEEIVKIQKHYGREGVEIRNSIQTNGLLLDDNWLEFCEKNNFAIGLSIDGHPDLHDLHRVNHAGQGTSKKVSMALKNLSESSVKFGTLVVVTEATVGQEMELMKFLIENNIKNLDFLPCFMLDMANGKPIYPTISPEAYANFLVNMFNAWLTLSPETTVRTFKTVLARMRGRYYGYCIFSRDCSGYITLDFDGTIWPCDNFLGYQDCILGNLGETSLRDIVLSDKYQSFMTEMNSDHNLHRDCRECKWLTVCQGGCPSTQFSQTRDFSGKEYYCFSRLTLFEHIHKFIQSSVNGTILEEFGLPTISKEASVQRNGR
jgi:uncharacterized protein